MWYVHGVHAIKQMSDIIRKTYSIGNYFMVMFEDGSCTVWCRLQAKKKEIQPTCSVFCRQVEYNQTVFVSPALFIQKRDYVISLSVYSMQYVFLCVWFFDQTLKKKKNGHCISTEHSVGIVDF